MTFHRNCLTQAIYHALGAGVVTSLALTAAPVVAQEDDESVETDRIVVTGSRITSEVVTASAPVAEIDSEEFDITGTTRVEDLLNQYPQMTAQGFNEAFTTNPTAGFPTASLRDLGSQRTLVLVNGHRLPPGGVRSQGRDLNTIPSGLIKRVDILTGGASAVYGSDAMAGVINFILDTDFTGFSASAGYAGYQHDNDNKYMQELQERAGFDYPKGNSGLDGQSRFAELMYGSHFDGGRGHAMGWITYRDNKELRQSARDYSSCSLNNAGTACGGSATAPNPTFLFSQAPVANNAPLHLNPDGSWAPGQSIYNFAPPNHLLRPHDVWTAGASIKYEINDRVRPYMDFMMANTQNVNQTAESGTFFNHPALTLDCSSPLLGNACAVLGLNPDDPVFVTVGKRNTEGGPRQATFDATNFRIVTGIEGDINPNWTYDASFLFGRNSSTETNANDLLSDRVVTALLACADPDLKDTPACYNVWEYGGVTPESTAALSGTGIREGQHSMMVGNAYVSGDLGFGLPSAGGQNVQLVVGGEWRRELFDLRADTNMAEGNFLGLGGPRPPVSGTIKVAEAFIESLVPLVADAGPLDSLNLDLGYRLSDYDTSGLAHTWKVGFHANFSNRFRLRGGWNRAIRSANAGELFSDPQIALFAGADPCSGATPQFTLEQCARTGVSAEQYGNIAASPASQYNQFISGNPDLKPEEADTYTLGFVITPAQGLELAVDYWRISMTDQIGTIGANTILQFCALYGDPFLCDKIRRRPGSGDLWVGNNPETSGHVENLTHNLGDLEFSGLDLNANYRFNLGDGMARVSLVGTYQLEQKISPLPDVVDEARYDCVGRVSPTCGNVPQWRHIGSFSYARDWWSVTARWRYIHKLRYLGTDGEPLTLDQLLVSNGNKVGSHSFFDLTGTFHVRENVDLTLGVNNILDKEPPLVGGSLNLNANRLGGYDPLGRYIHGRITFNF